MSLYSSVCRGEAFIRADWRVLAFAAINNFGGEFTVRAVPIKWEIA